MADTKDGCLHFRAAGEIVEFAANCDAVALGPGIGGHEYTAKLVHALVRKIKAPLVIDADGLNLLATGLDSLRKRRGRTVLTPHPGEMSRLTGKTTKAVLADPVRSAGNFAAKFGAVVVLKSHASVVSDGKSYYVNETGNPGMATGGTGDVLTGITVSLLAQGYRPFGAACLASYLLGSAGDLAAMEVGEESLVPTDIVDFLPGAFAPKW